ncbi:uncharacterized protein LOC144030486 isoform X2 [Festucalex cinctus]
MLPVLIMPAVAVRLTGLTVFTVHSTTRMSSMLRKAREGHEDHPRGDEAEGRGRDLEKRRPLKRRLKPEYITAKSENYCDNEALQSGHASTNHACTPTFKGTGKCRIKICENAAVLLRWYHSDRHWNSASARDRCKEWVDVHNPGALVIPFSCGLESETSQEEVPKFCTEHKRRAPPWARSSRQASPPPCTSSASSLLDPTRTAHGLYAKERRLDGSRGKIHANSEMGFVMAEVMKFQDLKEEGIARALSSRYQLSATINQAVPLWADKPQVPSNQEDHKVERSLLKHT